MKIYHLYLGMAILLCGGTPLASYATDTASASAQASQQQTKRITGTVVDEAGDPIIGASVIAAGASAGSITDLDGNFVANVSVGQKMNVSFIGYKPATFTVTADNNYKIVLREDNQQLDEVVVVGYGTQKRQHLTGAVSSVDVSKALEGRQIPDVGRGLQGTTPGLNIVMPNGEIGSDPTIRIRGQVASLNGSSEPLILLDNVEIPSIQLVNPDEVESITVLKDAASASIYGAKAAFGVILIQTKKGASTDRVDVSYSGNFAWQKISKDMEMATVDGTQYRVDALERSGGTVAGAFWYVNQEALERQLAWQAKYGNKMSTSEPFVYGRDWYVDNNNRKIFIRPYDPYDYMIRDWAPSMTHNLSVNGKSGKTAYNISLGYLDQNGLIKASKHDDFRRYNASARINTEISKFLSLRGGLNYSLRNKRYAYATNSTTADPWYYMYRWDAFAPNGYDENGNLIRSPSSEMAAANTANREDSYLSVNLGFTANFTKNWHLNFDYTFASENQTINKPGTRFTMANTWVAAVARYDDDGNRVYVNDEGQVVDASASGAMPAYDLNYQQYTSNGSNPDHIRRESTNAKRHTLNVTTDYDWQVDENNNVKAMIGMNRVDWESYQHWSQITNLTDILNPSFDKTNGTQTSSGNDYWDGQLGFFGRLNYALMDRYLFEASLRYDGSSKFPDGQKWRYFPSVSVGWRMDQEKFLNWASPVMNQFKLRGSWGRVGDQSVSSSLYIPTMSQGTTTWVGSDGSKTVSVGVPSAVDGSITWQDIETIDIGLDTRFFHNDLGISFDWYERKTLNMLIPAEGVPVTFGASAPTGNYGDLRSRGWEIEVNYNHRFNKDLSINATFTLSDAKTVITRYGQNATSIDGWYAGKEYGEVWGYLVDRLYRVDDFVYDADGNHVTTWALYGKEVPEGTTGAKLMNKLSDPNGVYQDDFQTGSILFGPGDIKYVDVNGDGRIYQNDNTVSNHGDKVKIGNTTPRYEYGIRLGINFRDFDFSIFGQGIGSRKIWGSGALAIPGFNTGDGAMPQAIAGNYWRYDRQDAFYPRAYNLSNSSSGGLFQVCDRYILNMAYFRIKNITLGYTLPVELTRKAMINKCRFYVACENFFTFDKLRGLPIDPEVVSGVSMWNSSNYNSGRTGIGTPAMKNVNVGIQLNF